MNQFLFCMNAQELTDRYHLDVYNRFPLTLAKGAGTKVWDTDGNEYLDALAGIAVNSLGHCHPKVVAAIQSQASKLMHISNFYYSQPQADLLELLAEVSGFDRIFLCNSGGEAMEGALKIARKFGNAHGKKGNIITVSHAFHGRTMATISMGMDKYSEGYDPLLSGFSQIPMNDIGALEKEFDNNTIAVVLETVQGSGGLRVAEASFMKTIEQLCRKHNALLIVDEVQTGMGRTGNMFGFQHFDVQPDIIALAKAMGGGFPIGSVLCRQRVADVMSHGDHGSTYGGNPLACAAAHAAIKTIVDEDLTEQARKKGSYLVEKIRNDSNGLDSITDIRGKGLMIGVELAFEGRPVVDEMLKRGVLSNCTHSNVMRLVPPLIISYKELDQLVEILLASIQSVQ